MRGPHPIEHRPHQAVQRPLHPPVWLAPVGQCRLPRLSGAVLRKFQRLPATVFAFMQRYAECTFGIETPKQYRMALCTSKQLRPNEKGKVCVEPSPSTAREIPLASVAEQRHRRCQPANQANVPLSGFLCFHGGAEPPDHQEVVLRQQAGQL